MNLNHLEYFVAACDTGSISEAAKKVYVSQQSVSSGIATLERELAATLLVRSHAGVAPTAEGAIVYNTAVRVFSELDSMRQAIAHGRSNVEGALSFAFIPEVFLSCGYGFEQTVMNEFAGAYPGIALTSLRGQSDFCLDAVKQGGADIALVAGVTDTTSFRVIPIWECPVFLYVRREHPLATRNQVSFADLRNQTLITPPNSGSPLWRVLEKCRGYGFTPSVLPTTDTDWIETLHTAPATTTVSFVLGGFLVNTHDPACVAIPLIEPDRLSIPANAIVRAGTNPSPQAEALIAHLRRAFAAIDEQMLKN